jgi:hypothetical protein
MEVILLGESLLLHRGVKQILRRVGVILVILHRLFILPVHLILLNAERFLAQSVIATFLPEPLIY